MTEKEKSLLNDLEAWRGATIAKVYNYHYITVSGGGNYGTTDLCSVVSVKCVHEDAEPEMVSAIDKVREAIETLEDARNAIVERKLQELRIAGMR